MAMDMLSPEALIYLFTSEWANEWPKVYELNPSQIAMRGKCIGPLSAREVAQQVGGYQIAVDKMPAWAQLPSIAYAPRENLAQCSSEETARFKAWLMHDFASVADLCGGLGVDAWFATSRTMTVLHNEPDADLQTLARHNLSLIPDAKVAFLQANAEKFKPKDLTDYEVLYLDPSRRADGQRTLQLTDFTPNVQAMPWLWEAGRNVLIKFSPGQDITELERLFPECRSRLVVSVGNECKEILLSTFGPPGRHAVELNWQGRSFWFSGADAGPLPAFAEPEVGQVLCEPSSAILKAGLHRQLASRHSLSPLHGDTHAYLSPDRRDDFEGKQYRILSVHPAGDRDIAALAKSRGVQISVRNYPLNGEQIRHRHRLKAGAEAHLFFTRSQAGYRVLEVVSV